MIGSNPRTSLFWGFDAALMFARFYVDKLGRSAVVRDCNECESSQITRYAVDVYYHA